MNYYTADLHLDHKNIIKYSSRPFKDVEEMNEKIISNWNSKISQTDTVYVIGDFCFCDETKGQKFLDRLNGSKILIEGNHDKTAVKLKGWKGIYKFLEIKDSGQDITLCHYAMRVWNKSHHGAWQLFGHSHGSLPDDPNALSFDVGVDCHNFTPLSFADVKRIMQKKTWKAVDHHGRKE